MSQVTEQSVRFQTALASIKLIEASAVLDLTEDDFDFLTSNKVWICSSRFLARCCVEASVYGTLVFLGFQAVDGIRDYKVTGVQTCALPICPPLIRSAARSPSRVIGFPYCSRCLASAVRAAVRSSSSVRYRGRLRVRPEDGPASAGSVRSLDRKSVV